MANDRVQRYKMTHEFVLRDRGDYQKAVSLFQVALAAAASQIGSDNIQQDYLAFEKVDDERT